MTAPVQYATQPAQAWNPFRVFTPQERLTMLLHGLAKRGKTSLSATAPKPLLALDLEGRWRHLPVRKVYWNPLTQPPPTWDGTWEVCVVEVQTWQTFQAVFTLLQGGRLPFVTVVLDSITELQRRCKDMINKNATIGMEQKDWGRLLDLLSYYVRGIRDLCMLDSAAVRCVVYVAESTFERGRMVPNMQGGIADVMPFIPDLIGFIYDSPDLGETGRYLGITPTATYEAGEALQGRLGSYLLIQRPPTGQVGADVTQWMHHLFHTTAA